MKCSYVEEETGEQVVVHLLVCASRRCLRCGEVVDEGGFVVEILA